MLDHYEIPSTTENPMGYLHIYAQDSWHAEAIIVGDETALRGLREAIDAALGEGKGISGAVVDDGEGYNICVLKQSVDGLAVPYTSDYAKDQGNRPWPDLSGFRELIEKR